MPLGEGVSEKKHRDLLSTELQRILGTATESLQYVGEVSTVRNPGGFFPRLKDSHHFV